MRGSRWFLALSVLAALALSACGGSGGTTVNGKQKVNFVLNYTPGPQHMEFVVAQHKGFYDKAGLDVNMMVPAATTDPIKLVASGQADVGVAYAGDVISAAAEGVPVEAIATIHRHITLGLLSRPGSGIKTAKDLIGKTVGLTAIPNNRAMFYDFLRRGGVRRDQVKVVPVNFNGPALVAAGKIAACDAVSWYEPGIYKQLTGHAPDFLSFTSAGVPDGYFFVLITSKSYMAGHRSTLKKFVAATLQAEKWTLENPAAAEKVLLENVKGVSPAFAASSRAILKNVIVDSASQTHGLGWSDPRVWANQAKFYLTTGQITKPVDTSTVFTNSLLPASPVTVPGK